MEDVSVVPLAIPGSLTVVMSAIVGDGWPGITDASVSLPGVATLAVADVESAAYGAVVVVAAVVAAVGAKWGKNYYYVSPLYHASLCK